MTHATPYADRITRKIRETFQPLVLELVDDSQRHHGHAGADPSGETHFKLRVVAEVFKGQSRVARQRLVYDLLKDEMQTRVHALSLDLKAPEEV